MAKQFASLDQFSKSWNDADHKAAIFEELVREGIWWKEPVFRNGTRSRNGNLLSWKIEHLSSNGYFSAAP